MIIPQLQASKEQSIVLTAFDHQAWAVEGIQTFSAINETCANEKKKTLSSSWGS